MKKKYEIVRNILNLILMAVLIILAVKTILEPRVVNILIGEDDVIDAIMCNGDGECG